MSHGDRRGTLLAALLLLPLLLLQLPRCRCCRQDPRTLRQCLYLEDGLGPSDACEDPRHVRLRFCDAYAVAGLLRGPCDGPALDRLRRMDQEARRAHAAFRRLLDRYDCDAASSVSWTCRHCQEAYKQWVCSMYLPPLKVEGRQVKPCRYICRLVEQRCPYFHPSVKEQYAGERVFKCIDPDIPDLDGIQETSSYGSAGSCYCPQHLGAGEDSGDPECRLLTPSQLRRNASRRGHRSGGAPGRPSFLTLTVSLAFAAWWTRTR